MDSLIEKPDIASSSRDYTSRFSGMVGEWFLRVQESITSDLVSKYDGLSFLDIGGGHGQNINVILKKTKRLTILGSDEICRHNIHNNLEKKDIKFIIGSFSELPLDDKEVDVVIAYRMMAHVRKWESFVREMCRVSRRSVIIDFPCAFSMNVFSAVLFPLKKKVEKNTRSYFLHTMPKVQKEFKKNGFRLAAVHKQYFFPMALHRLVNDHRCSIAAEKIAFQLGLTRYLGSPVIVKFSRDL